MRSLVGRQRSMVIVVVFIFGVIGVMVYLGGGSGAGQVDSATVGERASAADEKSDVFLPRANGVLRDPFRVKAVVVQASAPAVNTGEKKSGDRQVRQYGHNDFRLDGVVASEGVRAAIVAWKKKSGVYKVHDRVGEYEVLAINDDSVILRRNGQEVYLRVGGL